MPQPKQRKVEREPSPPLRPVCDMLTLDPDFDEPDQADAEFTAWRWPERTDE